MRPALVRETQYDPQSGRSAVRVSYGTTKLNTAQTRGLDFTIQNHERLDALGLPHAVRFDLGLFNWLPWGPDYFQPPEHDFGIVAGILTDSEKQRLRAALKRRGVLIAL